MAMTARHSFFKNNGLLIVFLIFMFLTWGGQAYTGWQEDNIERIEQRAPVQDFKGYLSSGHFLEATFENWESEFLQMALYVALTIFLYQKGSAESKSLDEPEEVEREPRSHPDAPWPVRRGGIWLKLYKHSLTITFVLLFALSFLLHAYGTMLEINEKEHKSLTFFNIFSENKFWFESLQNWQSEFLSIASIVFLSIYLRQQGSPESKPVDAPHSETGK
jgi:hypothetical protein